MGCWELFDLSDLPPDTNLMCAKWVLELKYKNGEYENIKRVLLPLDINNDKISTSLQLSLPLHRMLRYAWYLHSLICPIGLC
jgi:hypothetical protein